jgi:N-acetylglucosamine malate deacetylase 2
MNWRADSKNNWREISLRLQTDSPDVGLQVMVLAAHPDDETIGASALLSRFPRSSVAFVTDGAPRDRQLWPAGMEGSRQDYAEVRRQEAIRALGYAGISEERIFWLQAVDQEAAIGIGGLAQAFAECLGQFRPAIVITHSYEGGHPDHDSAAVVARLAITALEDGSRPALLEMTSYHARQGKCVTGEFLNPGLTPEFSFGLSTDERQRKRRMMDAYRSQRLVLENFLIDQERLRPVPEYDFSQPPHAGKLWYEAMGWAMSGECWRGLATAAIVQFKERSCR